MTCERSRQCDNAHICQFAQSKEYNLLGGSCFEPKDPQTNEEWFCGLSTEEKAETIANATYSSAMMGAEITALPKEDEVRKWKMWLKAPHDWNEWLKEKHE